MNKKLIGGIVSGVLLGGALILGVVSLTKIPAGYVGVQYNMNGGVRDEILSQGFHFVNPMVSVTKYSISSETMALTKDSREGSERDDSFKVSCKDGEIQVSFEMQYAFKESEVTNVFQKYKGLDGNKIVNERLRTMIKSITNEVLSNYTVTEAYLDKKADVNKDLTETLRNRLEEYGIYVESATLSDTDVAENVKQAIQNRMVKSQEVETAQLEKEKAEIEAQTKLVQARAESDANNIKQSAITDAILKQQFIEKWDGKLPAVNGNGQSILNIDSLMK